MQYPNFIKFIFYTCLSITIFGCKKQNGDGEYVAYFGGEIVNPNSRIVLFCKDDNVIDTIKLDKNNRFFIKFDSLAPGMYSFKHEPEYQYVYFDKNDSIMVRVNSNDFDNSLMYCGRGDLKNNFLMDLYLKNEKDKNKMFEVFEYDINKFNKNIDSSYQVTQKYFEKKKQEIQWDDDFDQYAKAAMDFHYYSKKELYPTIHKIRTGKDVYEVIPNGYYDFRKNIDYNNENLSSFAPFVMYLHNMLNNMGSINYHNHFSEADIALKTNINKLNIADTLIKNEKLKNIILNNIAFGYLLEDQNMINNKTFLDTYHKYSTDKSSKNEINKISNAIQLMKIGASLPEVMLLNQKDEKVSSNSFANKKTVIFFWTARAYTHFEAVHKKIIEFKKQYPDYQFVAVNLNDTQNEWKKILKTYNLPGIIELRCDDFKDIKEKWAINKIHRTIILDQKGKIKNAFTNIFDTKFEENLKN